MAEPNFPWVRPGGAALLQGLKAKPELNGQSVSILDRDPCSGRWRCKVAPFGEEIKVRPESLAKAPDASNDTQETGIQWLHRGVQAVVKDGEEFMGQFVRVLSVDNENDQCRCVVRATGAQITISRASLRPMANSAPPSTDGATAVTQEQPASAAAVISKPSAVAGSDWATVEFERRRLAEGFREGFFEGATVTLQGLKSVPELNGKRGKLLTFCSQSLRWQLEIENGLGTKALMPANLVPVRHEDQCDADEIAQKRQRTD